MPKLSGFAPVPIRGPRALPFVGPPLNAIRVFADPIAHLPDLHRRFGNIAAAADGSPALVCVFGAEMNREVLSNHAVWDNDDEFPVPSPKGSALHALSLGLPFQTGDRHRAHRRLLMPAFHKAAIDGYAQDIVSVTDAVLRTWPVGQTADVAELVRDLVRHVALKCIFGLDWQAGDKGYAQCSQETVDLLTSPIAIAMPYHFPGSPYSRLLRRSEDLVQIIRGFLAEKRRAGAAGRDVLSLLIGAHDQDGKVLSDEELVGEANMLFFAGYDTQAKTLAWTLFLLAQQPETAASLLDEVEGVLRGGLPEPRHVPEMPLLDSVVKESMRVLPAVPVLFFRTCRTEAKLGPYTLPPRSNVVLSPYMTHRHPDTYSDPERFLPSRWQKLQPSPYEYMPFGTGPRMCIGAGFATLALRLILPMIHQRYRLTLAHGARLDRIVRGNILAPRYGLPMLIAPQDRRFSRRDNVRGDILDLVKL